MLYVHDIWVNWFEGEENEINVPEFHEWRKSDSVELLDQLPVIPVSAELYDYIANGMYDIPKELLDEVYQRSYIKKVYQRIKLDYCFAITDGSRAMVVDTLGYDIPVRKSKLIPRQERLVLDLVKQKEANDYEFKNKKNSDNSAFGIKPNHMRGLTRRERTLKLIVLMALDDINQRMNKDEIFYWLVEWQPELYQQCQLNTFEEIYNYLQGEMLNSWSKDHEDFGKKLVQNQPFFMRLWSMETERKSANAS